MSKSYLYAHSRMQPHFSNIDPEQRPNFIVHLNVRTDAVASRPHQTGPRGGKLFEVFLQLCGSDDIYAMICQDLDADVGFVPDTEYYDDLTSKMSLRFYTWLMMGTHTRKKTLPQRQLIAFLMHFHGLTRTGLEILSRAGLCSSRSAFNRWWKSTLETQNAIARY